MRNLRRLLLVGPSVLLAIVLLLWWRDHSRSPKQNISSPIADKEQISAPAPQLDASDTRIHAHNLLLSKGPDFHVYVRWLDGRLARTRRNVNPSFDRPESFDLNVETGVIRVNIGDIGQFVNKAVENSPLRNLSVLADGSNLKFTGTVHKLVSLPVQVTASLSVLAPDHIRLHINKIEVLRVPLKGILGLFRISAADLVKNNVDGVEIQGNDILLDTHKLLPPPHIRGRLTQVLVDSPDVQAVYGDAVEKVRTVELWRNFFSLEGGTIDFGSLTMHPVKIIMIDISSNPWFGLDLVNYRQQFSSGYTRMTAESGLQIFIPDLRDVVSKPQAPSESIRWFKDRNIPPPTQITGSISH